MSVALFAEHNGWLPFQLQNIERNLQIKIDVRDIKEQFIMLLQDFERFQQWQMKPGAENVKYDANKYRPRNKIHGAGYEASQASAYSPRYKTEPPRKLEEKSNRNPLTRSTASASAFYPFRHPKHRRKKRNHQPKIVEDYTLANISEIPGSSEMSPREQNSRCAESGPLQSTFQYPQHSTPEKESDQVSASDEQSAVHKLTLLDGTTRNLANRIDSRMDLPSLNSPTTSRRQDPAGLDSAHFRHPNQFGVSQANNQNRASNSPAAITPIIRRVLQMNPNFNHLVNSSNVNDTCGSPTLVADEITPHGRPPRVSREMFLQTDETFSYTRPNVSEDSDSSDSFAETKLKNKRRSGPYLQTSRGLVLQESFTDDEICSTQATRDSEADVDEIQDLIPPEHDYNRSSDAENRSSDTIDSARPTDSSYKESDGQWSPASRSHNNTGSSVSMPDPVQLVPRHLVPLSSGTDSFASLEGDRAGVMAPVNSPNKTDWSAPSGESSSDFLNRGVQFTPSRLGARPPCIGDELTTPRNFSSTSTTPLTIKKRPIKRTLSLASPKPEPMASLDSKAMTDCDSSSSTSSSTPESSDIGQTPQEQIASGAENSSGSPSRAAEGGLTATPSSAKKYKRKLSRKLKSLKNRFRRKSSSKPIDL